MAVRLGVGNSDSNYSNQGSKSGAVTIDALSKKAGTVEITATGNITGVTINNPPPAGGSLSLLIRQDSTGGRTITLGSAYVWAFGTIVAAETSPNGFTQYEFFFTPGLVQVGVSNKGVGLTFISALAGLGPRQLFNFQETSGTVVNDISGNGRNGSYVGSPTLGGPGLLTDTNDKSVVLDGTSQYILAESTSGSAVVDSGLSPWSFVGLIKSSGTPDNTFYAQGMSSGATNPYFVITSLAGGYVRILWRTLVSGSQVILLDQPVIDVPIYDGTARLLAITYTPPTGSATTGTVLGYRDGVMTTTRTLTPTVAGSGTTDRAAFGARLRDVPLQFFTGSMSAVATFNRALSDTEIASLQTAR